LEEEIAAARRHLTRDAIIYTPLFILFLAIWVATLAGVIAQGGGGGILLLLLLTIMVFVAGYQSIQSLRDLRSLPVTSEGPVVRKWRRAEFLLFPAHYLYVNRTIFKVPALIYEHINDGDTVAIIHYRHTTTVVAVRRPRHAGAGPGA
jgi:hypothetical protein